MLKRKADSPFPGLVDRFVAYAARMALEAQPLELWRERALGETDGHIARDALLAMARQSRNAADRDAIEAVRRTGCRVTGVTISREQLLDQRVLGIEMVEVQAIEIDGAHYWDGGYSGNPALFPLFDKDLPDDVVVININPLIRDEVPRDPQSIQNRINEISFNSSLLRELRAIEFVRGLIAAGKVEKGAMKDVLIHMIADDDLMTELSVATKLVPSPMILRELKEAGRRAADRSKRTRTPNWRWPAGL